MNKILLILQREFITRVRKPSFIIMSLLGPLLIAGGITLMIYLGMQGRSEEQVLVIDREQVIGHKLRGNDKVKFHVDNKLWTDSAFLESPFTVRVILLEDILNTPQADLFYKELPGPQAQTIIRNELEKALELAKLQSEGIDEEAYRRVRKALDMRLFDIRKVGEESLEQERAGIGFFFGYFMFIFIFLYGMQVMRGVMEEKQNRVVEVIISSVRPFQLMMGKITGIALVGFTQFILWIVVTTALVTAGSALLLKDRFDPATIAETPMTAGVKQQLQEQAVAMPDVNDVKILKALRQIDVPVVLAVFVFFFIGGYLLYSSLLAAIGSAVDSEAETQQFMFPVTLPMVLAIVVAQMAVYNPGAPAVVWCSFIPFTSPVVMMVRVVMGNVPAWQLLLSMALLVITFIGSTWLAGRIYRTGILMYGKKASWKEIGKWLFYKG
ncbi:MAG: ABC transporter permease [Flavobacteriales bacterium]|nr:ABC transporter permease [Flavobacteriales bacterium]